MEVLQNLFLQHLLLVFDKKIKCEAMRLGLKGTYWVRDHGWISKMTQLFALDERLCFCLLKVYSKTAPSWANRAIFRSIPPAYPHKLPDEPMTWWQGSSTDSGLCATAAATDRMKSCGKSLLWWGVDVWIDVGSNWRDNLVCTIFANSV